MSIKDDIIEQKPKIISHKQVILNNFNEQISKEEKKYPLSDRERLFVNVIREILLNT